MCIVTSVKDFQQRRFKRTHKLPQSVLCFSNLKCRATALARAFTNTCPDFINNSVRTRALKHHGTDKNCAANFFRKCGKTFLLGEIILTQTVGYNQIVFGVKGNQCIVWCQNPELCGHPCD